MFRTLVINNLGNTRNTLCINGPSTDKMINGKLNVDSKVFDRFFVIILRSSLYR